ncbi:NGG1p interacting factor 3 [Pholiota conissans]|uniref:NGG1p interacting factor 3 n=1 Tax=Pholiota conissans TaxID=109636 RepID=A0A9P5YXD7_9AGAR|nr:NGG1p interacting factor 3 [Pholiota conissans]
MSNLLLKSVCSAMKRIAPPRLAEKWDNVGLLLESPVPAQGRKVLLTIDLTSAVLAESVSTGASVIVAYHPTIFQGIKSITLSNPLQASLLQCAAQGISVYSPHTSLDFVWGGINDWLAEGLMNGKGNGQITSLLGEVQTQDNEGGQGRLVTLNEATGIDVLEQRIKSHLKLSQIQVGYPQGRARPALVRTIAICAGSGGSMLAGQDADVYFTGEMQHHEVLAAVGAGKHVILCGHTNTERGYLPVLALKLQEELSGKEYVEQGLGGVEILVSQKDQHPLKFV